MNDLGTFDINFVGLNVGKHIFTYEIDNSFFDNFDESPIDKGDLYVHLTFEKKERLFILNFFIDGSIKRECDRCLDSFNLQLNTTQQIVCKFEGEAPAKEKNDPNIVFLSPKDDTINVAQHLYEFIILQLPMKATCEMDRMGQKECNPEMMKKLEQSMLDDDQAIDPRWNKLKDIKNN